MLLLLAGALLRVLKPDHTSSCLSFLHYAHMSGADAEVAIAVQPIARVDGSLAMQQLGQSADVPSFLITLSEIYRASAFLAYITLQIGEFEQQQ